MERSACHLRVIGAPIPPDRLRALQADPGALRETLRRATYALSPQPLASYDPGKECEAKYKTR